VTSPAVLAPGRLSATQHGAVLGGYLALLVLFTYPLVRDPGHLLPYHKDPMMYGWTMVSNTRRLLSNPLTVFHGNTFYPYGNVVAHSDLLITPTLFPAGPLYLLTGNPVLQYNLTLLLWWALSGWATYVLAFALWRSHVGATIAGVAFMVSPFRTDFYPEFQMQLAFPIPLALLALLRFLETQRTRYLAATLALLWVEALASMYYAIILGLCLATLALLHLVARPGAWSWHLVRDGAVGVAVLGLALAPFIVPYAQNRTELGMERDLYQRDNNSADILTYFETGETKLYHFSPAGHAAETSLFMGFVALALATLAFALPGAAAETPPPPAALRVARQALAAAALGVTVVLAVTAALRAPLRAAIHNVPRPLGYFLVILGLILARIALEGWWSVRADARGRLGDHELRWSILFLLVLFFLLSLGPVILYQGRPLGSGLYAYLYPYVLPLHAIRVYCRIGVIVVLGIALLAGLGARTLQARLRARPGRHAVPALLLLAMLAEYAPFPMHYQRLDWEHPPAVYATLAADPDDVAVLEWPQNRPDQDDYFTFMSINHWKRLVNGASGFSPQGPQMTRDISGTLSSPDGTDGPFPGAAARRYLLGIHPLRYVVVHNAMLSDAERVKWRKLETVPWARLVARYGRDDLYRLTGDMRGAHLEKFFSWDYARDKHSVDFEARAVGPGAEARWIDVALNGRQAGRQDVRSDWIHVTLPLAGPRNRSAPNVTTVDFHYRGSDANGARRIGKTGVASPVDLQVVSAGMETGNEASIHVNGREWAVNRRGYNVVAIDPVSGDVLSSELYDTLVSPGESGRLAAAISRLTTGTIVAVAVKDEASGALTGEAVAALQSLGGTEDIRGRYRVSHLLVGVKGAAPGTAIERSGYARLTVLLGYAPGQLGIEMRAFALR
jgi:interleukin-like EMT inducer protein